MWGILCVTITPQEKTCGVNRDRRLPQRHRDGCLDGSAAFLDRERCFRPARHAASESGWHKKTYWYDHFRLGNKTIDRYIGEDTPELRMQLDRQSEIARAAKQAQRDRARLMRVLRAEGYLFADVASGQVVSAMAKAGVFRLGGTIVGTQAFRCYEGELGVRIGFDQSAATDDIDIASFERLSLALADTVEPPLAEVFAELQFDPLPTIDHGKKPGAGDKQIARHWWSS
ncbi:GSU2403 family nucleotidyltransferase fold protein [Roseibium salinum]|nr:GSU2403 family nucleotidyltransferase fold protein [Roseibium salinum]